MRRSAALGSATPEGWLWAKITGRLQLQGPPQTTRGYTAAPSRVP